MSRRAFESGKKKVRESDCVGQFFLSRRPDCAYLRFAQTRGESGLIFVFWKNAMLEHGQLGKGDANG